MSFLAEARLPELQWRDPGQGWEATEENEENGAKYKVIRASQQQQQS